MKSVFKSPAQLKRRHAIPAIAISLVIGVIVIQAFAAGPAATYLLKNGTLSGNATVVANGSAIGGSMVRFGGGAPAPTPTPTVAPTTGPTATPKPTATPPAFTPVCPAFPAFPDESCTGWQHTGVTLHNCNGTLTTPNVTLDSCYFPDGVSVRAANITIKRSHVKGLVGATYMTDWDFQNLTLIDVEIENKGYVDPNGQAAIGSNEYTCIRCNIHDTGRGANLGYDVKIYESYIHDQVYVDGAHQTAIGSNGGGKFEIVHNNLQCNSNNYGCSSALSLYGDFSPINDVLIKNNLLNTDGGYCTYGGSTTAKPYPKGTNIRYIDNYFGKKYAPRCGSFGPVATWQYYEGDVWSGNVWADGSGAVTP